MATRYLITGATGATGGEVARLLLERGASVRALAHREDERSRELQQRGAEVVYGNLLNFDAMRSALAEVDRTYFCYPISPGIVQATAQFAQAAKESGVAFIVNMSQRSARGMRRARPPASIGSASVCSIGRACPSRTFDRLILPSGCYISHR